MTKANNSSDKETILSRIKAYNEAYRKGEPQISDAQYDELVNELKCLDPDNDWFKHIEPVTIGKGRKVKLPIPMKSLNKVKSVAEIKQWLSSMAIPDTAKLVITPKFDGVSWLRDEIAQKVYSRGGADNEGQDCSPHYNLLASYKPDGSSDLHYTFGELVFDCNTWEQELAGKASDATGEKRKSPRNTIAGLINRDEPSEILKHTTFYRYGVGEVDLDHFQTYSQLFQTLCEKYHQPIYGTPVTVADLDETKLADLFKAWRKEFYIDGLVIYLDDLNLWKAIGRQQTTGNPLYAIAYKHPDFTDTFETTVKGVTWKASKSGALKPVVNIEMVDTGDCNMENPTGYNAGWIYDHKIAKGAKILVTRSGGVIPKILETLQEPSQTEEGQMWMELCCCPHCGAPTKWNENDIELCCTSPSCPGIQLAKIVFFYTVCGAENMGEETLDKIYKAGFRTIPEILNISFQDLMNIEGFAEATSNIILDNNKKILEGVDLPTLMQASDCFKGIGKIKAQKFLDSLSEDQLQKFCDGDFLLTQPETLSDKFKALPITEQNLILGYLPFMEFLHDTQIPIKNPAKTVASGDKCKGMAICVSGFRDSDFEAAVINESGKIVSGVSKKTTHLVVKDKNATSSKITKAQSMNIQIMSIDEFTHSILG